MDIVVGRQRELGHARMAQMGHYRYEVFVDALGWDLACQPGCERDQFDHEETLYLLAYSEQAEVVGTARLLPTHQPYLLGEVFPELMAGQTLPRSADVWELSRFCAMELGQSPEQAQGQFSSVIATGLLDEVLRCAAEQGARQLITVSPLGIERLLRRAGYKAHRAAAPIQVGGHWLFACWIDVPSLYQIGEVTSANSCRSMHRAA